MAKQKTIVLYVVALIAIVAVYAVVLKPILQGNRTNVANPDEVNLKEVSCDISVSNPRGFPFSLHGDLIIDSAVCQQQYVNNCGRFGIFADTGTVRLSAAGGLGSGTDVNIGEGSSQSYTLTWCGSKLTKLFKIDLIGEDNKKLQTKEVTLQ